MAKIIVRSWDDNTCYLAFIMKNCIVCKKEIKVSDPEQSRREKPIKKYGSVFCNKKCVEGYEKMLEDARKKVNLDKCC